MSPFVRVLIALAVLVAPPAATQTISDVPAPVGASAQTSFVAAHVEVPAEIALGTMALNVWARVEHEGSRDPISGATLTLREEGAERRIAMRPVDGAFDSAIEEVVATVDTYTWVRDAAHEYEIRAMGASARSGVAARGAIRVRPRISTPDLVLFDASGLAHAWIGSGAGGFTPNASVEVGLARGNARVLDVDGDRFEDVLVPTASGTLEIFRNRGGGRLESSARVDCGGTDVVAIAVGDLDGDAQPDIVTVTQSRFLEIREDLADLPSDSAELTLLPDQLALADLDGDGRDEIYIALLGFEEGEIQVWTRLEGVWAPTGRLGATGAGRGRIQALVRASGSSRDQLLVVSVGSSGEGMLESWGMPADTGAGSEPSLTGRYPVPGEPLGVLNGRFHDGETASSLALIRDGSSAVLFGIRSGEPMKRVGFVETAPAAFCGLDLDGDGDDDLVTGGEDLRLWINVQGEAFREAGESPYLLEEPVIALAAGSLDERLP